MYFPGFRKTNNFILDGQMDDMFLKQDFSRFYIILGSQQYLDSLQTHTASSCAVKQFFGIPHLFTSLQVTFHYLPDILLRYFFVWWVDAKSSRLVALHPPVVHNNTLFPRRKLMQTRIFQETFEQDNTQIRKIMSALGLIFILYFRIFNNIFILNCENYSILSINVAKLHQPYLSPHSSRC